MRNGPTPRGVIAIIRLRETELTDHVHDALIAGGLRAIEVTVDTPGSLSAVQRWARRSPALVGVGTVRTAAHADAAIAAGAQFLVTPTVMRPVLDTASRAGVPVICGAMTPTEIDTAWSLGATAVKVFPIDAVGADSYISALQGPLPEVPLVPTGGVNASLTRRYAELGCAGAGVGSALVDEQTVMQGDWHVLEQRADEFVNAWTSGTRA